MATSLDGTKSTAATDSRGEAPSSQHAGGVPAAGNMPASDRVSTPTEADVQSLPQSSECPASSDSVAVACANTMDKSSQIVPSGSGTLDAREADGVVGSEDAKLPERKDVVIAVDVRKRKHAATKQFERAQMVVRGKANALGLALKIATGFASGSLKKGQDDDESDDVVNKMRILDDSSLEFVADSSSGTFGKDSSSAHQNGLVAVSDSPSTAKGKQVEKDTAKNKAAEDNTAEDTQVEKGTVELSSNTTERTAVELESIAQEGSREVAGKEGLALLPHTPSAIKHGEKDSLSDAAGNRSQPNHATLLEEVSGHPHTANAEKPATAATSAPLSHGSAAVEESLTCSTAPDYVAEEVSSAASAENPLECTQPLNDACPSGANPKEVETMFYEAIGQENQLVPGAPASSTPHAVVPSDAASAACGSTGKVCVSPSSRSTPTDSIVSRITSLKIDAEDVPVVIPVCDSEELIKEVTNVELMMSSENAEEKHVGPCDDKLLLKEIREFVCLATINEKSEQEISDAGSDAGMAGKSCTSGDGAAERTRVPIVEQEVKGRLEEGVNDETSPSVNQAIEVDIPIADKVLEAKDNGAGVPEHQARLASNGTPDTSQACLSRSRPTPCPVEDKVYEAQVAVLGQRTARSDRDATVCEKAEFSPCRDYTDKVDVVAANGNARDEGSNVISPQNKTISSTPITPSRAQRISSSAVSVSVELEQLKLKSVSSSPQRSNRSSPISTVTSPVADTREDFQDDSASPIVLAASPDEAVDTSEAEAQILLAGATPLRDDSSVRHPGSANAETMSSAASDLGPATPIAVATTASKEVTSEAFTCADEGTDAQEPTPDVAARDPMLNDNVLTQTVAVAAVMSEVISRVEWDRLGTGSNDSAGQRLSTALLEQEEISATRATYGAADETENAAVVAGAGKAHVPPAGRSEGEPQIDGGETGKLPSPKKLGVRGKLVAALVLVICALFFLLHEKYQGISSAPALSSPAEVSSDDSCRVDDPETTASEDDTSLARCTVDNDAWYRENAGFC